MVWIFVPVQESITNTRCSNTTILLATWEFHWEHPRFIARARWEHGKDCVGSCEQLCTLLWKDFGVEWSQRSHRVFQLTRFGRRTQQITNVYPRGCICIGHKGVWDVLSMNIKNNMMTNFMKHMGRVCISLIFFAAALDIARTPDR